MSSGHEARGSGLNAGRCRGSPGIDLLAGKVDRGAFAHPGGALAQGGIGHQVHELVADRAIEHAAIAQHGQRQQVQLVVDDRRRR